MNDILILLFMLVLVVGLSSASAQARPEELNHKRAEVVSYSPAKQASNPDER